MKGFRKMDEMEQFISLKSLKIAYGFTIVFLFIWFVLDYVNTKTVNIAFILLTSQNLILGFSKFYFKRKMECK